MIITSTVFQYFIDDDTKWCEWWQWYIYHICSIFVEMEEIRRRRRRCCHHHCCCCCCCCCCHCCCYCHHFCCRHHCCHHYYNQTSPMWVRFPSKSMVSNTIYYDVGLEISHDWNTSVQLIKPVFIVGDTDITMQSYVYQ